MEGGGRIRSEYLPLKHRGHVFKATHLANLPEECFSREDHIQMKEHQERFLTRTPREIFNYLS